MWGQKAVLSGTRLELRPLTPAHAPLLLAAAADGELWRSKMTRIPDGETVAAYIGDAVAGVDAGHTLPFATTLRANGMVVGSTRFWLMDRRNRSVEIGHTWISAGWQRSYVNTEAKYLMLRFAFDVLGCIRVQFQTDVLNDRSRAAILRLGAQCEGVARQERIMPDGRIRDSIRFSIIDGEWPLVRENLERRLDGHDSFSVREVSD